MHQNKSLVNNIKKYLSCPQTTSLSLELPRPRGQAECGHRPCHRGGAAAPPRRPTRHDRAQAATVGHDLWIGVRARRSTDRGVGQRASGELGRSAARHVQEWSYGGAESRAHAPLPVAYWRWRLWSWESDGMDAAIRKICSFTGPG